MSCVKETGRGRACTWPPAGSSPSRSARSPPSSLTYIAEVRRVHRHHVESCCRRPATGDILSDELAFGAPVAGAPSLGDGFPSGPLVAGLILAPAVALVLGGFAFQRWRGKSCGACGAHAPQRKGEGRGAAHKCAGGGGRVRRQGRAQPPGKLVEASRAPRPGRKEPTKGPRRAHALPAGGGGRRGARATTLPSTFGLAPSRLSGGTRSIARSMAFFSRFKVAWRVFSTRWANLEARPASTFPPSSGAPYFAIWIQRITRDAVWAAGRAEDPLGSRMGRRRIP